jgi:pimeloyl-ACP methyl ester carboxylesterase
VRADSTPSSQAFVVKVSGHGRPVVFIPDLAASGAVWDTTVAHLHGNVEAHVLTIAGFAGVAPVTGPLLPKVTGALAAYLRERGLRSVVVVGHMFGAAIAYSIALAAPDVVSGVVAIDVLPCQAALGEPTESREKAIEEARAIAARFGSMTPEQFAARSARRLSTMVVDQTRVPELVEQASRSTPRAAGDAYLDLMTLDLRDAMRNLRPQTLVVVTDLTYAPEDWDDVLSAWHRQVDTIPRHVMVPIRGSRHYVMYDQPQAFFETLDGFLAKLPL